MWRNILYNTSLDVGVTDHGALRATTSSNVVLPAVELGPPDLIKSRTFTLRFVLEVTAL